MSVPQTPYDFPTAAIIFDGVAVPPIPPARVDTVCQERSYVEVNEFGHAAYTFTPRRFHEFLFPYGTDVRDAQMASTGVPDRMEVPAGSGQVYEVQQVSVLYRQLPRQCVRVIARWVFYANQDRALA